jgi:hypothetical protein
MNHDTTPTPPGLACERRQDARMRHGRVADLRATVRPGWPATVIDLSAGGMLIEAPRPLRPGARVHLQVIEASRQFAMAAHVLRCAVAVVDPEGGVRYRAALRFDQPCPLLREGGTLDGSEVPRSGVLASGRAGHALPVSRQAPRAKTPGRAK